MTPEDEKLNRELRERLAARKQSFESNESLRLAFQRSRDALLAEARRYCPSAEVLNFGPDLEKRSDWWGALVRVDSDATKRALQNDDLIMQRLRNAAHGGGFAPEDIEVESEETVNRDF